MDKVKIRNKYVCKIIVNYVVNMNNNAYKIVSKIKNKMNIK